MADHWKTIEEVRREAVVCYRCDLSCTRKHVVFGKGPASAQLMIVGEGPGTEEDAQGEPFVGRAGKLLDKILAEAGIRRDEVWVTNTVRCRPVSEVSGVYRNRTPRADEIKACEIWMDAEYSFVSPRAVVCLGTTPAQALISHGFAIGEGRGKWYTGKNGVPTSATYHPASIFWLSREDRAEVQRLMTEDFRMAVNLVERGAYL